MDAETSAKLLEIATEYREMLNGKAPADAEDRPVAAYARFIVRFVSARHLGHT